MSEDGPSPPRSPWMTEVVERLDRLEAQLQRIEGLLITLRERCKS